MFEVKGDQTVGKNRQPLVLLVIIIAGLAVLMDIWLGARDHLAEIEIASIANALSVRKQIATACSSKYKYVFPS